MSSLNGRTGRCDVMSQNKSKNNFVRSGSIQLHHKMESCKAYNWTR